MDISPCNDIKTEFDEDSRSYYVFWQPPVVIGAGRTEKEALDDFREAVRFCIENLVDTKMKRAG